LVVIITTFFHNLKFSTRRKNSDKVLNVIGLDTEAYTDGKCFLIALSTGEWFTPDQIPHIFFTRRYRGKHFVCYNLRYDAGAILQRLPEHSLKELWKKGKTEHQGYVYRYIPHKMLSIRRDKNTCHFWDMASFFNTSLEKASQKILGKSKLEIDTKDFTPEYVEQNFDKIVKYCIQDAILVKELADVLLRKFNEYGVNPRKLYSTAYVSNVYFQTKTSYPTIKRFWNYYKELVELAWLCYWGGKFEVVEKGCDYYYQYDINSAYPYEIANLVDISKARVEYSTEYIKEAVYGFLKAEIEIPQGVFSPVVYKRKNINIYPCGKFVSYITKQEYDFLVKLGCKIKILQGAWLIVRNKRYPFRTQILKLYQYKQKYKEQNNQIDYHIVKILLNSLYGKFVQLIKNETKYYAYSSFNPIYASVITANVRIRMSELQNKFKSVVAVHTDSVISTEPLDLQFSDDIGDWNLVCKGEGVIIGSGVYQIKDKTKIRGFPKEISLFDLIKRGGKRIIINEKRPLSWTEVVFHNWEKGLINRFELVKKEITPDFDKKRIWLNDYQDFSEIPQRKVKSIAYLAGLLELL